MMSSTIHQYICIRQTVIETFSSACRVLGHFEKPIFLELCKYTESRIIPAGNHVFRIGDADDSIYVVQSGKVDVYITDWVRNIEL